MLDFNARLLLLKSGKNWGSKKVIEELSRFSPAILACDVSKPPRLVKELHASFESRLCSPEEDLTIAEKNLLTKGFKTRNKHERDALASAVKALHWVSNKLRQIDRHALGRDATKAKALVMRGTRMSEALKRL